MKHSRLRLLIVSPLLILLASFICLAGGADLTWNTVTIPDLPNGARLASVSSRTANDVYVLAARTTPNTVDVPEAFVFRWNGASWSNVFHLPGHDPQRLFAVGVSDVYLTVNKCSGGRAAGCGADAGGKVYRSSNNGASWSPQSLPGDVGSNTIDLIAGTPDNIHIRVNSVVGRILHFDGTTWRLLVLSGSNLDGPYGLHFRAPDEGYFVSCWGWGRWDGTNWVFHNQGFDFCDAYGGLWATRDGVGALHMYAAGNNNFANGVRIWKFDETNQNFGSKAGSVFQDGSGSNIGGAVGIWGSAWDDVYVIGGLAANSGGVRSGRLYHFDGTTWARVQSVGEIAAPIGISGTARDDVWIALQTGTLLHLASSEPSPQNVISITSQSSAAEPASNGTFRISRQSAMTSAVTISYSVAGSATPGVDYTTLSGVATIPAGSDSTLVSVVMINDSLQEETETVTLSILPNASYQLGSQTRASIALLDEDSPRTCYTFSTFAGTPGSLGAIDGPRRSATLYYPHAIAIDQNGVKYIADTYNYLIRRITTSGIVETVAGKAGQPGSVDGVSINAQFRHPRGIAVDKAGNILIADLLDHTIRKIAPSGAVSTFAGLAGTAGSIDGPGAEARFNGPTSIAVDQSDNAYVAETGNHTIRKITPSGVVSTLAGLAGSPGSADGEGSQARFNLPS